MFWNSRRFCFGIRAATPNLRAMYDENDGNTQVLYFKRAVATFSSFTAPAETIEF